MCVCVCVSESLDLRELLSFPTHGHTKIGFGLLLGFMALIKEFTYFMSFRLNLSLSFAIYYLIGDKWSLIITFILMISFSLTPNDCSLLSREIEMIT